MKKRNIVFTVLAAGNAAYAGTLAHFYNKCFKWQKIKKMGPKDTLYFEGLPYLEQQKYTECSIESRDGLCLKGYYFNADSKNTIILVHGYHMTGFQEFAGYLEFYQRLDLNVLIIDQRSHGKSEGKWIGFGYQEKYDVIEWAKYLQKSYPYSNLFFSGISMGASTVLLSSGEYVEDLNLRGIIADCGFSSLQKEVRSVLKRNHIPASLYLKPISFLHKLHMGYSIEDVSPVEAVKKTNIPILYIHGTEDHYVPVNHGYQLYQATRSPAKLYLVKDATHARSYCLEKEQYEKEVTEFIHKYLK